MSSDRREEVVIEGSKDRLAPVLMTAAAAALGLLPLVFGDAAGKELERPMAYVILGGLFTSTILNMIVVPTVFAKFGWESDEAFARQIDAATELDQEKGTVAPPASIAESAR